MKIYPVKAPGWPAAARIWLNNTDMVAPGARVPSDDMPGNVAVLLVVNENGVPAPVPVALFGKKLKTMFPAFGVAPPAPDPNGSAVVFAIAIPVSYGGATSANGINKVVLAGTILTIVSGPISVSLNVGYPAVSEPMPNPPESRPVPIGNIVAVTLTVEGVATDDVVVSGEIE